MARKKPTYRQRIAEDYEYYRDRLEYFSRMYGLSVDKKLQEPKYKESRKRNYESFNRRMWAQIHSLRDKARELDEAWDKLAVQHGIEAEAEQDLKKGRKGKNKEPEWTDSDDYDDFSDFDASRNQTDTGEYEYASFEETLYEHYMNRLYYYRFIPSIKALLDTIESDEEYFKNIIIQQLSKGTHGVDRSGGGYLPDVDLRGSYEYGAEVGVEIQDFLTSYANYEGHLYDEAYDTGEAE